MATRERRRDRGHQDALHVARATGADIRLARRTAGISLRAAGEAVGLSESTFGRLERGRIRDVTVEHLALACAAVGLRFVARPYPDGDPVRDAAHAALLGRLRGRLPRAFRWRTEVPLPVPGDLRAWDAVISLGTAAVAVEAETRLSDLQALERRIALKRRDGRLEIVLLLVSDTRSNRRFLAGHREPLRTGFPLDTRAVMAAFAAGRLPPASGVVVL